METKILRPDTKGRVTLGPLAKGVSGFQMFVDQENHKIVLLPLKEVPAHEQWLYLNETALKKVKAGLKAAEKGKLVYKGSFAKYAD